MILSILVDGIVVKPKTVMGFSARLVRLPLHRFQNYQPGA